MISYKNEPLQLSLKEINIYEKRSEVSIAINIENSIPSTPSWVAGTQPPSLKCLTS